MLSHKGRAGSLLLRLDKTCVPLSATRHSVRGLSFFPSNMRGVARRKAQNLWLRIRRRTRRAPLGAPVATFSGTGPRFPVRASRSSRPALLRPPKRASRRREAGSATPKSSASSWQGFVVSPGGAPVPPECLVDEPDPRGTAPRPASRRLMRTPLQKGEVGAG